MGGVSESGYLETFDLAQQFKAHMLPTLLAEREQRFSQKRGCVHQAMRIMMDPVDAAFRYQVAGFVTVGHMHSIQGNSSCTGRYINKRCFWKACRLDSFCAQKSFPAAPDDLR